MLEKKVILVWQTFHWDIDLLYSDAEMGEQGESM